MNRAMWLLSLSRPLVYRMLLLSYITDAMTDLPGLAVYTVAAAFFLASSAVVVGWVPAPRRWQDAMRWAQ